MAIAREETFGPVAPIMRFDSLEEAIAIGNETEFGLTAAVFTNSLDDAWTAASELRHGTVHINETTNYWIRWRPSAAPRAPARAASWPAESPTPSRRPSRSRSTSDASVGPEVREHGVHAPVAGRSVRQVELAKDVTHVRLDRFGVSHRRSAMPGR